MSCCIHSQVTASSATTGFACYGYIKQSTRIDKLSLRLREGGSCVNIIMVLSVTLTSLGTPPWSKSGINTIQLRHTRHMYFNCMYTTPSAVCLCDNIGLVSLILLGWELHVSYITVVCVQGIPILSPLLFMPSLYSTL